MLFYLSFGLGFYIGVAVSNTDSFMEERVTPYQIVKGVIFGIPLWPIALSWVLYKEYKRYYE